MMSKKSGDTCFGCLEAVAFARRLEKFPPAVLLLLLTTDTERALSSMTLLYKQAER